VRGALDSDEGSLHSAVSPRSVRLVLDRQTQYMDPSSSACAPRRPRFLRMTDWFSDSEEKANAPL
jgi:hypothetical protein